MVLCECGADGEEPRCGVYQEEEYHDGVCKPGTWMEDYGLVLRGPVPGHPGRIMMVLAGAHALGTGAACLAATRPDKIREIRAMLPKNAMEDKGQLIWALVKGTAAAGDYHLDGESVEVVKVWPAKADAE